MFTIEFLQKKLYTFIKYLFWYFKYVILQISIIHMPTLLLTYSNTRIGREKGVFLCSVFLFHSHSKVNCGKKQIIIPVSTNSTPKYPFLTPYLPICTQLKIENIVSFFIYTICFAITSSKIFPGVL